MTISRSLAAIIVAIILSLGLIISVIIYTHYHKWNHYGGGGDDNNYRNASITVTGIAEKVFPADYIKVSGTISNNKNKEAFINNLLNKDISKDDITFTNNNFIIQSEFVKNVEDIINNKPQNQALTLNFDKPKYYLKNLDDVRLQMLAAATKKAKAKAGIIIENGNGVLGSVIQSDMGEIKYYDINPAKEHLNASELSPSEKRKKVRLVINQVYNVR